MQSLEKQTLQAVLDRSAAKFANEPAVSYVGGEVITYVEFAETVASLSRMLGEYGVVHGDKVAILSESCPHWSMAYFAITCMGAVAVPILPDFHPDAIHHILRHSESRIVFVSEKLYPKLEDGQFDEQPQCILMETFSLVGLDAGKDKLKEIKKTGLREFRKWKDKALRMAERFSERVNSKLGDEAGAGVPEKSLEERRYEAKPDDVAAIIYTSGTTGHSKGVVLTHSNIVSNAVSVVETIIKVGPGDRLLSILPLSHTYECTLGMLLPLAHGAHIYYMDKPPTARALLPALSQVRPTIMLSVPLVIEKIFKTAILPKLTGTWLKRNLYRIPAVRKKLNAIAGKKLLTTFGGCLRMFCIGGAALAPDVELFLREAGFPYGLGYGLTETSPLCAGDAPGKAKLYSIGKPLHGVEIRIMDKDPATGEGEIAVKGPNVMREYYKAPEITKATFTADGWFLTGDLGKLDADGHLTIKGRLKNVIVGPSGENIYPEEIEGVIMQSPWVLECIVYQMDGKLVARVHIDYAKADEEFGSLPAAKMQAKVSEVLEALRQEVNGKVSAFSKLQKVIEQTEPFEKTPTHKIKRYLYVD
ncbi:AMP-binding protein [Desulfovibrio mangrovi]|uniref:AMP-binding protein n=1 Tax=Desulfovibrio mangrovi TaxID=2976983 RepID=UPI00224568CE|nr:AMP-binding protein [Desulfovibrio mangrovi]UZP66180.1 AMP-binding protein [Desulfovibrio mangrovi]